MRLVVALCGVLSGAAALGFGWWGQQTLLFDTKALSPTFYVLVVLFVHLLALGSIGGGMAVLVAPRVGRVAMLSSAVGWLLLIALLGGGIKPVVALLMALSAAGGLGAFLPSVQTPLFRLERVDAPMWQPSRRRRRTPPPLRPKARSRVQRAPAPPPPMIYEVPAPPPYEDHSRPFVAPSEEEEDHSRPFVEPPPEPSPAIGAVEREDFFGDRRRPASPPRPPRRRRGSGTNWASVAGIAVLVLGIGGVAIAVVYDSLTNEGSTLMPATTSIADVSSDASEAASEERVAAVEPSSSSELSPASSSAGSSSEEDRLPSGSPNLALVPSQLVSSSEPAEIDLADDPGVASSSAETSSSSSVAAISSLLPSVDASMAALPPITPPSTFSTPFNYCASVGNTDSPDAKKITGGVAELTKQARTEAALPTGEVRWRCMENAVWVCVQPAGALSCDKVPSATDRVLICAAHPDTPGIRNAGGDWSCNGFTPVVSAAQLSAADRRGFDKAAWKKLTPPPASTG